MPIKINHFKRIEKGLTENGVECSQEYYSKYVLRAFESLDFLKKKLRDAERAIPVAEQKGYVRGLKKQSQT